MKKTVIFAALVAALLNVSTLNAPAPASAESGVAHDRSGEVPAFMDVVKLNGKNGQRNVRVVLHVRDLQDRGKVELGVIWRHGFEYGYYYFVRVRQTDDGIKTEFRRETLGGDSSPEWTCGKNHGEFAYQPAEDRVMLTVPHGCLRAFDGIRVINNWGVYANTWGTVRGHRRFDAAHTGRLERG